MLKKIWYLLLNLSDAVHPTLYPPVFWFFVLFFFYLGRKFLKENSLETVSKYSLVIQHTFCFLLLSKTYSEIFFYCLTFFTLLKSH